MSAVESMIYVSASPHEPVGTLEVPWRFGVTAGDRILSTGRRTPHGIEIPPEHLIIEGPDVGYDGRLHLGVAVDANDFPSPRSEDIAYATSAAE